MTTITLSRTGFREVHPFSTGGRLGVIALILGGTRSLANGLSVVTAGHSGMSDPVRGNSGILFQSEPGGEGRE